MTCRIIDEPNCRKLAVWRSAKSNARSKYPSTNIDLTTTTTGYRIVKRGGCKWRAAAGRNFSMPCRAVVDRIPLLRQRPIGVRQRRVRVGPDRSADIFNCVERRARHPAGDVASRANGFLQGHEGVVFRLED